MWEGKTYFLRVPIALTYSYLGVDRSKRTTLQKERDNNTQCEWHHLIGNIFDAAFNAHVCGFVLNKVTAGVVDYFAGSTMLQVY
jgi:hypothetical protein